MINKIKEQSPLIPSTSTFLWQYEMLQKPEISTIQSSSMTHFAFLRACNNLADLA